MVVTVCGLLCNVAFNGSISILFRNFYCHIPFIVLLCNVRLVIGGYGHLCYVTLGHL